MSEKKKNASRKMLTEKFPWAWNYKDDSLPFVGQVSALICLSKLRKEEVRPIPVYSLWALKGYAA